MEAPRRALRAGPRARRHPSGRSQLLTREFDERVRYAGRHAAAGTHERDLPRRLEAPDPCLGQCPAVELALDGRPRDERHTVPGLDRALHRLLEAELEAHAEIAEPSSRRT